MARCGSCKNHRQPRIHLSVGGELDMPRTAKLIGIAAGLTLFLSGPVSAQQVDSSNFDALRYRYIGPEGNRISTAAGIPGDPNTYYAGAA